MRKNVVIARQYVPSSPLSPPPLLPPSLPPFSLSYYAMYISFDHDDSSSGKDGRYIDVWPLCVRFNEEFDNTFTLLLQLACIIHMKGDWTKHTIRIFVVVETDSKTINNY